MEKTIGFRGGFWKANLTLFWSGEMKGGAEMKNRLFMMLEIPELSRLRGFTHSVMILNRKIPIDFLNFIKFFPFSMNFTSNLIVKSDFWSN